MDKKSRQHQKIGTWHKKAQKAENRDTGAGAPLAEKGAKGAKSAKSKKSAKSAKSAKTVFATNWIKVQRILISLELKAAFFHALQGNESHHKQATS